mgnify:CR=1 FL=1|jgi:hypothetical protein
MSYDQSLEDKIEECQVSDFDTWHSIPKEIRELYSNSQSMVCSIQQAESDLNSTKKKYGSILRIMNEVITKAKEAQN